MFCDKKHINQLTALLKDFGIRDLVVCPGSRNGALVHNFSEAKFRLHPVTDERSAAFVALGLCLSTRRAVGVCVTSGSALLNTLPAVAEAHYRQLPLLVISADRPQHWIGQLDGQTLAQTGALQPYATTYTMAAAATEEEAHWYLLQANEALLSLHRQGGQPVHLNVPIAEPLFSFTTPALPQVRTIREETAVLERPLSDSLLQRIRSARFPIMVIGQYEGGRLDSLQDIERKGTLLVLPEPVSGQEGCWRTTALEHLLPANGTGDDFCPDLVLHLGGNLVNKQLKLALRRQEHCEVVRIAPADSLPDTFCHLHRVVRTTPEQALPQLARLQFENKTVRKYQRALDAFRHYGDSYVPTRFSDLAVMQHIARQVPADAALQVGNSSVIRNAAYFLEDHTERLFCNRGVNGIEGSLSAAVGYAMGTHRLTLSLIGDLSFFYDQNALWNKELPRNLRIVLFNNGGGQIFYRLPGLDHTPALSPYIAAAHHTQAAGIAAAYGLRYLAAHSMEEVAAALPQLWTHEEEHPVLLEVFTAQADNEHELKQIKQYYAKTF